MNIFENYLNKIKEILINESSNKKIILPENLDSINVEIPPSKFNCDLSTNVAMVLSKINKMSPQQIGEQLKILMLKIDGVENVTFVKPGFLNLNLKNNYWNFILKDILKNQNEYGVNLKESKKYLIEFVSANPTGPLHVGHCRGAILGDVISNLLIFNKHHVTKEYYVNDYGNQINSLLNLYF